LCLGEDKEVDVEKKVHGIMSTIMMFTMAKGGRRRRKGRMVAQSGRKG